MKKTTTKASPLKIFTDTGQLWLPDGVAAAREKIEPSLIEMKAFGLHVSGDGMRPLLLLKDLKGENTVGVTLSSIDAAVAVAQSNPLTAGTPHRFVEELVNSLNLKITRAVLVEVKNGQQYMRLDFSNHPTQGSMRLRADECMSVCLHMGVPIYAAQEFIRESRTLAQDLHVQSRVVAPDPRLMQKNTGYLM